MCYKVSAEVCYLSVRCNNTTRHRLYTREFVLTNMALVADMHIITCGHICRCCMTGGLLSF